LNRRRARSSSPSRRIIAGLAAATVATGVAVVATANPATAAPPGHFHVYRSSLSAAQIKQYSKDENKRVIVLLRNQLTSTLGGGNAELGARSSALARAQAPIASELRALHTPRLTQYHFINAVSGTISSLEEARLKHNPDVLAVVPDRKVSLPAVDDTAAPGPNAAADPVNKTPGLCGTPSKPLLEPEALGQIKADTTHSGVTGKGVKVAVFPDGLDPNIKDYIRPNGQHVVFDYQDFTGDGRNGVTEGAEAYGDVSSIAAQGRSTFDLSKEVNPNLPLPKNCDIRIKGVAPGAQVAVMKIFGLAGSANSLILQGLDWAVSHDHVDVLSQSFGGNPSPMAGHDPIAMFDHEAVQHGITVLASTGDAGITNTIGSPASDAKGIIAVGGTSSFRSHAQVSEHGYQLGHDKGWENNNIATLSSTGFTSFGPNSVDVVAPGDSGWSDCSKDTSTFVRCANEFGVTSGAPPIELFGGTSESCPLAAGVAALVIQAYRTTHHGDTPSPNLVKRILMSSATNLNAPAEEQGAGQVNAARAVALARAYHGTTAHKTGSHLLLSASNIENTAAPGSKHSAQVTVHNYGSQARTVHPQLRHFTSPKSILDTTVTYDPTAPGVKTFDYWLDGQPEQYVEKDFTVPSGQQRLDVRLGFPGSGSGAGQEVFLVLFDPHGKLAQDSDPQGAGSGFAEDDVRNPAGGKWRAIIFSRPAADKYSGPVAMSATVQKLVKVSGSSLPSKQIPAGGSANYTITYDSPAKPGDSSAGVYFGGGAGVLPVLMRTTVPVSKTTPGTFSGRLTSGNGRPILGTQAQDYEFNVPANVKDTNVDIHVAHPGYELFATLVAPNGDPVDTQSSLFVDETQPEPTETNLQTVHLSWQSPSKGKWLVELITISGSGSGRTSTAFTGQVAFDTVSVTSTNVPDSPSTVIDPDTTTTASVTVTNTGNSPEIYYVDPRTTTSSSYALGFLDPPQGTVGVDNPQILVPPNTSSLVIAVNSSRRIQFDTSPSLGSPDVMSSTGKTAVAGLSAPIEASEWSCGPSLLGPFKKPAPSTKFSCNALGTTRTINDDIDATGGNLWDTATDPGSPNVISTGDATVVQPGESTVLTVHISPSGSEAGKTVRGFLAVQTLSPLTFTSDELVHVPYAYKVGPAT
jgi:hypothetical protein